MINQINNEIISITRNLVQLNLSVSQNFPIRLGNKIAWSGFKDISVTLKNLDYATIYSILSKNRNFNLKLLDGSLLQLQYSFKRDSLISHRLAYYPNPGVERYEDDPEGYNLYYFGDSMYHDMIKRKLMAFPIRFDYDNDVNKYKELEHTYCHLHLGEYGNCRIPVKSPLSPRVFLCFILRFFYPSIYATYTAKYDNQINIHLNTCLSELENRNFHLVLPTPIMPLS